MERTKLEALVVQKEWDMFQKVNGIGGRAACQDQMATFIIMRTSQFESWEMEVVESYLQDLIEAEKEGRNLVMEKYAYMMEETDPLYYEQIRQLLPKVSPKKILLAEKIVTHYMAWVEEFAIAYPHIRKNGRPAEGVSFDGTTSLKNYLQSELYTYSERTLELFAGSIISNVGLNRYWLSMERMVQAYGYNNLDEAEADLM